MARQFDHHLPDHAVGRLRNLSNVYATGDVSEVACIEWGCCAIQLWSGAAVGPSDSRETRLLLGSVPEHSLAWAFTYGQEREKGEELLRNT